MSAALRTFLAVLIVAAVAFGGALYIGYNRGLSAAAGTGDTGNNRIASLDLSSLLGPQVVDEQLVGLAYRQVQRVYYRPFDAQTLVDGERSGLLTYMREYFKAKHIAVTADLPSAQASTDQAQELHALDGQLSYAQQHYAKYLGQTGRNDLTQAALAGMLGSLRDPYTVYLSPDQIRQLNEQLNGGNFGGIGVFIYQLKNGQVVLQPIDGLPAAHSGMKGNEVVEEIDGTPVHGLTLDRVERMIRGPEGTVVRIRTHPYNKNNTAHQYSITREIIHVPTVHAKIESGYEYIRLSDFGETSADEVHKALAQGRAHGAKGVILDLRDNGGGLLDAAVNISSYFVPQGVIVTEIDRYGKRDAQYATGEVMHGVTPLVVLVNGYTASASEITAGALQDYKIGTLIGTKTFGKGVVQGIYSMPNGGALKITTQRYLTPSWRDIQHKGIAPNIVVNQSPDVDVIDTPADKQLTAAKAYLNHLTR
jgi:carboxyl-terminal processing protease